MSRHALRPRRLLAVLVGVVAALALTGLAPAAQAAATATVSGVVTAPDGSPVAGVQVNVEPPGSGTYYWDVSDASGHYAVTGVPAGSWEINAYDTTSDRTWKSASWDGSKVVTGYTDATTTLAAGSTTTINWPLTPTTGFIGKAVDASTGASLGADMGYDVQYYDEDSGTWEDPQFGPLRTDPDGTFFWATQPGVKYRFCFYDDDYEASHTPAVRYADACYQGATAIEQATTVIGTDDQPKPVYTVPMTVAGKSLTRMDTVVEGPAPGSSTLTARPGTWGPSGVALSYQWKRLPVDGNYRNAVTIPGATAATYTPGAADDGQELFVEVTGSLAGYASTTTNGYGGVVGQPYVTTASHLTITGTPAVGQTLHASHGAISPSSAADDASYSWYVDGVEQDLPGGSVPNLTITPAMAGKTITARLGAYAYPDNELHQEATTGPVQAGTLTSATPTISGTATSGSTLTATAGTWGPSPVTLGYQWYRSGVAISGATASTFKLSNTDAGRTITVAVTGSKTGYTTATRTSAATAAVKGTLTAPTPTVSGTLKVGSTLTAKPGTWGPAPVTLAYQWYRSGTAISGATKSTYKLATADKGKQMSVRVTGTKTSYTSVAKTSARTGTVG